jgi:hypothetical protein
MKTAIASCFFYLNRGKKTGSNSENLLLMAISALSNSKIVNGSELEKHNASANEQLRALGLTVDVFQNVMRSIYGKMNEVTEHHAVGAKGVAAYQHAVPSLRAQLCPTGWMPENSGGVELVISPDRRSAIMVSSADANTGTLTHPTNKNDKGPNVQKTVSGGSQLSLELSLPPTTTDRQDEVASRNFKIWWFLYHVDEKNGELRCELSLPAEISSKGYVSRWADRIIIPAIVLSSTTPEPRNENEDLYTDTIDLDLSLRE